MRYPPRMSVVIPVYNAEEWLSDALDSVLSTPPGCLVEVICVDDGSTDSSGDILKQYAPEHPSMTVISQPNSGHAAARNAGLRASTGDYVWFVDSDDYIDTGCIEHAVRLMDDHGLDILAVALIHVEPHINYHTTQPITTDVIQRKTPDSSACSGARVFRRSLLTENAIIWREDLSPNDDFVFIFESMFHACNIGYNSSIRYYQRVRPDSVSNDTSQTALNRRVESFLRMAKIYQDYIPQTRSNAELRNVQARIGLSIQTILLDLARITDPQRKTEVLEVLRDERLYPYPLVAYNLKPKLSVKRTLMDWSMFLFPIHPYYEAYYALFRRLFARRLPT